MRRSSRSKRKPKLYSEDLFEHEFEKLILKRIQELEKSESEKKSNDNENTPNRMHDHQKCIIYDIEEVDLLKSTYPNSESYWKVLPPLGFINSRHPIILAQVIDCNAPITSLCLSSDGLLLACCTLLGEIHLYANKDVNNSASIHWTHIGLLRDEKNNCIDQYFHISFTPCSKHLFAAGSIQSRSEYDFETCNLKVYPPSLVKYDLDSLNFSTDDGGIEKVSAEDADIKDPMEFISCHRYFGHIDDIQSLKLVKYKGENYVVTCGKDGHIIKWQFDETWTTLVKKRVIRDKTSKIAFTVSFLPGCGNRYFLAATDNGIQLCDFGSEKVLQRWKGLYNLHCDSIKFVRMVETKDPKAHYIITHGVEYLEIAKCKSSTPQQTLVSNQNSASRCDLWKLVEPSRHKSQDFDDKRLALIFVNKFTHIKYIANYCPMKPATNGRYLLSPTTDGKVFTWNLKTGNLTALLADHARNAIVNDILFHPNCPQLFTAGSDGKIIVYTNEKRI